MIEFKDTDWVLCEIKRYSGDVEHTCIFTNFRLDVGVVTMWNPSHSLPHQNDFRLSELFSWKPLRVIDTRADWQRRLDVKRRTGRSETASSEIGSKD
jgi:hypothetical protein